MADRCARISGENYPLGVEIVDESDLVPTFEKYQPEVILLSTGFDAHSGDNLAGIRLSTEWFSWMMKKIVHMAQQYAEGRVISVLEGGYALEHLPELAKNHIEILLGKSIHTKQMTA